MSENTRIITLKDNTEILRLALQWRTDVAMPEMIQAPGYRKEGFDLPHANPKTRAKIASIINTWFSINDSQLGVVVKGEKLIPTTEKRMWKR